jgi:uncharacterized membrane protein YhaH (DUF805 family)
MAAATRDQLIAFFYRPVGRIGRLEYCLGVGFIMAIGLALLAATIARGAVGGAPLAAAAVLAIPLLVAELVLIVKRVHDFGLPGSFCILLAVPGIGPFWLLALAVIPGDPGPNLYGAAPRFRSRRDGPPS